MLIFSAWIVALISSSATVLQLFCASVSPLRFCQRVPHPLAHLFSLLLSNPPAPLYSLLVAQVELRGSWLYHYWNFAAFWAHISIISVLQIKSKCDTVKPYGWNWSRWGSRRCAGNSLLTKQLRNLQVRQWNSLPQRLLRKRRHRIPTCAKYPARESEFLLGGSRTREIHFSNQRGKGS